MAASVESNINPEMLQWVRKIVGMPLEVAARKIGVTAEELAAWEAGDGGPTIAKLRRIAEVHRRGLSVFYLPQPPEPIPERKPDFRRFADSWRPASFKTIETYVTIRDRRISVLELYRQVGEAVPELDWNLGLRTPPAAAARRIREWLGVPDDLRFVRNRDGREGVNFWRETVANKGVLIFQQNMPKKEARAFALVSRPLPTIVINSKDAATAKVFSIAHELVHVLVGSTAPVASSPEDPLEEFCNSVAGHLLVPDSSLREELAERDLTSGSAFREAGQRYGVSGAVMLIRARDAGFIDQTGFDQLWPQLNRATKSGKRGGQHYRNRIAEYGRHYVSLVLYGYQRGLLTGRDVHEHIQVKPDGINKLAAELAGSRAAA